MVIQPPSTDEQGLQENLLSLCAISDVTQRGFALVRRLWALPDEKVIEAIHTIQTKAHQRSEGYTSLYNGLMRSSALRGILGPDRLCKLTAMCKERDASSILPLLTESTSADARGFEQPFLDSGLKDLPLGMRKALARRPDFAMIQRIAKDQEYRVVRVLLDNPRLIEADVIKIGATRPTSPKVIEEIFNNRKWISRHRVKKALILNPHTPLNISLQLLTYMNVCDLRQILDRSDLHPQLMEEGGARHAEKSLSFEAYTLDNVD